MKIMDINSRELRQKLNKLHTEMGWVSMADVKTVITELEQKHRSESEFFQMLDKL